jgi:hypothetical protein
MSTFGVLVLALALMGLVFYWSGRYGGRERSAETSLRRGPRAHTTSKGRPKIAYATREEAEARARSMRKRDGASMSVYQCGTSAKWRVGHEKWRSDGPRRQVPRGVDRFDGLGQVAVRFEP